MLNRSTESDRKAILLSFLENKAKFISYVYFVALEDRRFYRKRSSDVPFYSSDADHYRKRPLKNVAHGNANE